MNTHDVVQGTLKPDGTLELNNPPNLTPGPVLVTIQTIISAPPSQRGLAHVIDEITHGQQARGFQGRSAKEIDTDRLDGEDEDEQRLQGLWSAGQSGPFSSGS